MLDWNDQLRTSLIWLVEAFVVSSIGLTITVYLLALFTEWGRQVRRISWEYFKPSRGAAPLASLALIVLMTLTVRTPSNVALVKDLSLELPPAASLLIRGQSGIGKSTLLRAMAGLWPYVDGTIGRPLDRQSLFLPQRPYLPLGTLRVSLYYPGIPAPADDQAAAILRRCHLGHLLARLDEEDDWTRILSLGEQQRLAFGRVLLSRPRVAFLDEASSAMDEGLEHAMYRLLRESLPGATLISVGHRSSLLGFHTRVLELLGEGKWRLQESPEAASNAPGKTLLPAHTAAHS